MNIDHFTHHDVMIALFDDGDHATFYGPEDVD